MSTLHLSLALSAALGWLCSTGASAQADGDTLSRDSLYQLEIVRGLGGGHYPPDIIVELRAYIPEGATFTGWTLEGPGQLLDESDPLSSFTTGAGPARLLVGLAFDSSALRIRAYGACGSEGLTLQIDGRQVRVWQEVGTEPKTYYYGGAVGDQVRVWLNNAGEDERGCARALTVEYVEHEGERHLGAAQVRNTGQRNAEGFCVSEHDARSAVLTCRGYIDFATMAPPESPAQTSGPQDFLRPTSRLAIFPNPLRAGQAATVDIGSAANGLRVVDLHVLDVRGRLVYEEDVSAHTTGRVTIAGLDGGVYLVRARLAGGGRAVGRLLVAR